MQVQDTNPQFPHWVKITRVKVNTNVNPPTSTSQLIYEGKCRNYPSRSGGTGMTEGVFVSDYTISIPFNEIRFESGDSTEITDRSRTFTGTIVNSYNGNLGCTIWHNKVNN
jgi:hypothetical protein